MRKILFSKARFVGAYLSSSLPTFPRMPEIALVGRSNVGKSSLINHLLKSPKLAKTSATPGKTQTLNFFIVDEELVLVDLPGYGYAKVPKAIKMNWAKLIDEYLQNRAPLNLSLLLLDIRRTPNAEDLSFAQWALFYQKKLLLVFTKTDKVSALERDKSIQNALQAFGAQIPHVHYSIKDPLSRTTLINEINKLL